MAAVKTGLDRLVDSGMAPLQGKRVALLGNPASVDKDVVHLLDRCLEHKVNLVRLFGPEHGIIGDLQDMDHVQGHRDPRTGIDVVSLYGTTRDSLFMKPDQLRDVDVLVCDLQDIGARYYTYAYTIAFALRAAKGTSTKVLVLDRPNPIGAHLCEGNWVGEKWRSFVGEYPILNRTGLTMGELAHLFVELDKDIGSGAVDLEVVWMDGYRRSMLFPETGLPFVLPSPNMPTYDTALVYPGGCLYEGTNLSEGRGTTKPFELVGAPYIDDAHAFVDKVAAHAGPGVAFRPCAFRPTFQKHAMTRCGGLQMHVTDPHAFHSLRAGVAVLHAARTFEGFDWRRKPYEYVSDRLAVDLLFGDAEPRKVLDQGGSVDDVMALFDADFQQDQPRRAKFLHTGYPD